MALMNLSDPGVMEKALSDFRKEWDNMLTTLITVQPMSGDIFQPMRVLKTRYTGRNPCDEITLGKPITCSLPYELEEEDTPEQAYERAMKGI